MGSNGHFASGWRGTIGKVCIGLAVICFATIIFFLPRLNNTPDKSPSSSSTPPAAASASEPVGVATSEAIETYDDITALFVGIVDGASVSAMKHNDRIDVTITDTGFGSEDAPENWDDIIVSLASALVEAKIAAEGYGCTDVSVQLNADDGVIMASGFNANIRFNKFSQAQDADSSTNPPTITKFEYDQIVVGMTYSQVVGIIGGDGTLQIEVGEAGGTFGSMRNYTWQGEGSLPGSATISFDDYVVRSKFQIGLT